jgi:hypothetical protein
MSVWEGDEEEGAEEAEKGREDKTRQGKAREKAKRRCCTSPKAMEAYTGDVRDKTDGE